MIVILVPQIPMKHFVLKMVLVFILIQLSLEKVKSFAEKTEFKDIIYLYFHREWCIILQIGKWIIITSIQMLQ